ncbi:DnaJ-like protein [Litorimonas taeanensis]|uniref:DnaJ-like protein n=1 Tax=Litorimonas taeanensis TaxID=568099 RepID=A0A420WD81_9PROT|nr:J domain-containing protein [Litorimonas taeanensis]RKQ68977.1 DnaJ-like protein [Litorimonas taeanensis]
MSRPINAYPLQWPQGHPRQGPRKATSQFRTQLKGALNNVKDSLQKFGNDSGKAVTNLVISSDVTLGVDNPPDSGVAVYFDWAGEPRVIPVDRYSKVQDNLQAIHHIIEARRTELRHGGLHIVKTSFAGFKALPPPADYEDWQTILKLGQDATRAEIFSAYKNLAKIHHPDKGGNEAEMQKITAARDTALAQLGQD